jgi:hypothetical protein
MWPVDRHQNGPNSAASVPLEATFDPPQDFSDSFKAKFNREGHSLGPFDRTPPNRSAHLYSVTGAMRTSGGFSAAYPAL